jgi:hypothetical protein
MEEWSADPRASWLRGEGPDRGRAEPPRCREVDDHPGRSTPRGRGKVHQLAGDAGESLTVGAAINQGTTPHRIDAGTYSGWDQRLGCVPEIRRRMRIGSVSPGMGSPTSTRRQAQLFEHYGPSTVNDMPAGLGGVASCCPVAALSGRAAPPGHVPPIRALRALAMRHSWHSSTAEASPCRRRFADGAQGQGSGRPALAPRQVWASHGAAAQSESGLPRAQEARSRGRRQGVLGPPQAPVLHWRATGFGRRRSNGLAARRSWVFQHDEPLRWPR